MQFVRKKWVSWLILITFTFQYIFIESFDQRALKQILFAPFKIASSVFSPSDASASTAPDPSEYAINMVPGDFYDISASGNKLILGDQEGIAGIPIEFGFTFYGTAYNTITITSTGYITFSNLVTSQNAPMPSTQLPNNIIAPFWGRLNPSLNPAGGVYYKTIGTAPGRKFIVQWDKVPLVSDPGSRLTFEVVLFEGSNEIQFQYLSMIDSQGGSGSGPVSGSAATIGIENADGTKGTEVAFNLDGAVTGGSAFSFTIGGNAFQQGRLLGDIDSDKRITVLDQSALTDTIMGLGKPHPSLDLLLSDLAPQLGTNGRAFGDGVIGQLDHQTIFDVLMGRKGVNPVLSGISYIIAPIGETLTLYGSGFDCAASQNIVVFSDYYGNTLEVTPGSVNADCTELTVTVPGGLPFIMSVNVERGDLLSNGEFFLLESMPVIASLTPNSGQNGDSVQIKGYEFGPSPADNLVSFNGVSAVVNSVSHVDEFDVLTVSVPAGATTGAVTVTVGGKTSNGVTFTIDGYPVVAINTPAADSEITAPTQINGTATDMKFVSYTLSYAPLGQSNFTTIGTGTSPVTNGALGTFDPTMLLNGLYTVRLSALDADGHISSINVVYTVKGEMKVGNFTVSFTDVSIPVAGIPVTVTRTYDSRYKKIGDFGYGWKVDIQNIKIEESMIPGMGWTQNAYGYGLGTYYCIEPPDQHYISITLPDGRVEEFDMVLTANPVQFGVPENCQRFVPIMAPIIKFKPKSGTTSSLTITDPVDPYYFGDVLYDIDTMEPFDPSGYTLTTVDGMVYQLDQGFGVRKVIDPNGNSVTYNTNGIVHSAGKSISFTRDAQGRITRITDPMGNTVNYSYNAGGDLVSVTDQGSNVTQFTYNSSHGLIDIIDPLGRRGVRNEYDASGRLIAHIDAEGNRIEYTHNIGTREEIVKDRLGNITLFAYDAKGQVVSKTDPLGNTTTYTYDAVGNKLTETDPLGNTTAWTYDSKKNKLSETKKINGQDVVTRWTYNATGKVLTTTDPMGRVMTNTYDAAGNLLTSTDALGNVTTNTYDTKGNLLSTTDSLGNITRYEYDGSGNRTKQTDPLNNVTTYTYDSNGNKLTETDPRGGVTTYTYDSSNRQVSVRDPLGNTISTEYDKTGKVSAKVDALSNRTTYVYNTTNKLSQMNYPDGTNIKIEYDFEGNRTASIDQLGRKTEYQYNKNKQLLKVIYADGTTQNYGYDAAGRQISITDEVGNVATKVYDSLGRVVQDIDPIGNTTSFEYDLNWNQISRTNANGNKTRFVFDSQDQQVKTILPAGQTTTIAYDALGRRISEADAAGNITQFGYDAKGNLSFVTDALGGITRYEYDANGNRTVIQDANGHRTAFVYDLGNRLTSKTMPNGGVESYTYDAAGRQLTKTDAKSQTIQYGYDTINRLLTKTYPDSSTMQFTYTLTGKRSTVTDKRGITGYAYDIRDRMTGLTYPDSQTINYTYDLRGNIKTISSFAGTVTYNYSSCCGRLQLVTDPWGDISEFTYDAAGNRTGLAYPKGTSVSYTYDVNNRLTNLTHKHGINQIFASYTYTLGPIGNRTRIDEGDGIVRQYTYDALYRLTGEQVIDPAGVQTYQTDYLYDAVGNRLTRNGTSYTYNNADQLVSENGVIYAYDLNGNLTSKSDSTGTTKYAYDYDNRLIRADTPSDTITYKYDLDGNRVEQTSGSGTIRYLVDINRKLAQVLAEYTPSGTLVASYVYADDLISMTRNGQTYYYHFDGLGSTRLLTDLNGTVTDLYDYDAFGNLIARTGTTENPFLFTGQQYDANIGFYYLRARYYQPSSGRFNAYDPFEGDSYAPVSLHKYLYAANDPINKIDPTGCFFDTMSFSVSMGMSATLSSIAIPSYVGVLAAVKSALTVMVLAAVASCALASAISAYTSFGAGNPCDASGANIFFSGWEMPQITKHIEDAIAEGKAGILQRSTPHPRGWLDSTLACKGNVPSQSGKSCDEYPFSSTKEGGFENYQLGRVSTRLVPVVQQSIQGGKLGAFYGACKIKANHPVDGKFAVVPTVGPSTWRCGFNQ
jgi:RHS repeat-associated protein